MGLLSASLRAVLSPEGKVLLGSKFSRVDQPRWPPFASFALPQRRNQGTAEGAAALHHPGPVRIRVIITTAATCMVSSVFVS